LVKGRLLGNLFIGYLGIGGIFLPFL